MKTVNVIQLNYKTVGLIISSKLISYNSVVLFRYLLILTRLNYIVTDWVIGGYLLIYLRTLINA